MKKLFKSMFVLAGITASLLVTSCKKTDTTEEKTYGPPTVTISEPTNNASFSLSVDSITIRANVSAVAERKIVKTTIVRTIIVLGVPESPVTVNTATQNSQIIDLTFKDPIAGQDSVFIDEGDQIQYTVTAEDDKGKTTSATTTVKIESMAKSGDIILGGPSNTSILYRFFGTYNNFKKYVAGTVGSDAELASKNSDKIDFLYFFNAAGSVQNAIYSPDYPFGTGSGWNAETSTWPTKNTTGFILTPLTSSEFDALAGSTFVTALSTLDFSASASKLTGLSVNQVFAYKKGDGKRGFVLVGAPGTSAAGFITFRVKAEL